MLLTTCFSAALAALNAGVQGLVITGALTQDQGTGLIDKINAVNAKLEQGQTGAACNQLSSFINQVNAFTTRPLS